MQQRSEETRQRIVKVAMKLFSEKGYDATGVAEICRESGTSKGALYHHFPSKQAIFLGLLKEWLQDLDRELARAMEAAGSVPDGLMGMAAQMKGVFEAADGRVQLFLEFWQQARRDPEVWKEFVAPYRRYQAFFSSIVARGVAEGSLGGVDPGRGGHALVALAVGILVQGVLDPQAAAWDRVTRESVGLLIWGMSPGADRSARSKG